MSDKNIIELGEIVPGDRSYWATLDTTKYSLTIHSSMGGIPIPLTTFDPKTIQLKEASFDGMPGTGFVKPESPNYEYHLPVPMSNVEALVTQAKALLSAGLSPKDDEPRADSNLFLG